MSNARILADLMGTSTTIPSGKVVSASLPSGSVLQVVQATKDDTFFTQSTSPVDVTGLSASITPSSTSNKILVSVSIAYGGDINLYATGYILRGSTEIGNGAASSNRTDCAFSMMHANAGSEVYKVRTLMHHYLDSPATTSATTYKIQVASEVGSRNLYINRSNQDDDADYGVRPISVLTLMEIAG